MFNIFKNAKPVFKESTSHAKFNYLLSLMKKKIHKNASHCGTNYE